MNFFAEIEDGKSLIFYYANYSNPFSEEESPAVRANWRFARSRELGDRLTYEESNDYIRKRYAGGMIWARNVSSHYPDEGIEACLITAIVMIPRLCSG